MRRLGLVAAALVVLVAAAFIGPAGASHARATAQLERYLVQARSPGDLAAVRGDVLAASGKVVMELPELNTLVVVGTAGQLSRVRSSSHVLQMARDHIEQIAPPAGEDVLAGAGAAAIQHIVASADSTLPKTPIPPTDPAFGLPGLMWNMDRIGIPAAWGAPAQTGLNDVVVGVADTGLDYTHFDLQTRVAGVHDFTTTEDPNICSTFFGLPTDQQLAVAFGAPAADLDFNGHGTWIGGAIAGHLDQPLGLTTKGGINGIAPGVSLYALKISQNCGSAYDSNIIAAFLYAANNGLDVVNISFGGYLDRTDPSQNLIYNDYVAAVAYARMHGTVIVAAAGNEHTRIGSGGQVISHGILDTPPGGTDNFGLWEVPGGVPGVVDVSSVGNVVNAPSASCPGDALAAGTHGWCKPMSDLHQPFGVGKHDQLAYYSNYGPRIDIAAPGGARKFNLPAIDRGGCEGWPWCGTNSVEGGTSVADGYSAWEDFSITSNYATEIPCFTFTSDPVFPANQCYAIIQGTSMAAPHVAATVALIASNHAGWRKKPNKLIKRLLSSTDKAKNTTPPVSATDTTPGDLGGAACTNGYCHLGGKAISSSDAYGHGIVDAAKAVK